MLVVCFVSWYLLRTVVFHRNLPHWRSIIAVLWQYLLLAKQNQGIPVEPVNFQARESFPVPVEQLRQTITSSTSLNFSSGTGAHKKHHPILR